MEYQKTRDDLFKKIGWFVVVLSVVVALVGIKTLKEYRFIGKGANETNQFSVTGTGEVYASPDIAQLSFTVEKEAKTVKEANTFVDEKMAKIVAFLKEQKIDEKDIKTVNNSFYPVYDYPICSVYPCNQTQKLRGYTTSRTIEVKIRNIDTSASVTEGLAKLEVTNLQGPNFVIDDTDKVFADARDEAIKNAKEKAESLAKALGVKIIRVIDFSESNNGGNYPPGPMMYSKTMMVADMAVGSATPESMPQGENKYTSDVTIVYEIR